jgi:LDH2 family malate/lactate/ureidoglycolate dehydrogenase
MYLSRVLGGGIDPTAKPRLVKENKNMAVFDACNGMGQIASVGAMKKAIEKAATATIGICAVRNSNHYGTAAYYSMMATEHTMIGISCSNTEPLMPAPGGGKAVVGNNPLSVAVPQDDGPPIVLDMAVSAAAIGKILLAEKRGATIPPGWATDKNGVEAADPAIALDGGMLLPVGGPKGYGLSFIVDALAGILSGSGFGSQVRSPFTDKVNPQNVGHLFVAIDLGCFLSADLFLSRIRTLCDDIKSAPTAPGVEAVFLPGEIESTTRQQYMQEGIPLPVRLVNELNTFAGELGESTRLPTGIIRSHHTRGTI